MARQRNFWNRQVRRRAVIRGGMLGAAGLSAAALIGCGDSDEDGTQAAASSPGTQTAGSTGVAAGDVRVPPGIYDAPPPPTAAELDPLANGRYGGTLLTRYLDPPHMDFNQVLSCTINTTLDYTKNKLTRVVFGPLADPNAIDIESDLAESWEVEGDATKFTFKLRAAKFHNVEPTFGRELSSEDVKLSFERYQAGGTQQDMFTHITMIETPDDSTVVVHLSEPIVEFPQNIAAWSHIDAREMIEDPEFLREHAVGTGPFIQESWTRKESSVFVRNPDYFETGLPFLDRVVGQILDSPAARRSAYETNNVIEYGARDLEEAASVVEGAPDTVHEITERLQGSNSNVIRWQMASPEMQDERVRRAASMAIDRREYATAMSYAGDGFPTPAIAWQQIFDTRPVLEEMTQWVQYNPAEASKLMQAAGYSSGSPFAFEVTGYYPQSFYRFDDLVLPMLNDLPEFRVSSRTVDNPTAVSMLNDRSFTSAHGMTYGPPAYTVDQVVFPFFHSRGGANFSNINDPELDRLAEAQRQEPTLEGRREIWRQIWDRDLDQQYNLYIPEQMQGHTLWHNYMINYRRHGLGSYTCYGNGIARNVWLDEGAPTA